MEPNPNPIEELFELCEQRLEGTLSRHGAARLEQLVGENPEIRRAYVEYLHQHANLYWCVGAQGAFSVAALERQAEEETNTMPHSTERRHWFSGRRAWK